MVLFFGLSLLPQTAFAEGDLYNNPTPPVPASIAYLYAGQINFTATTSGSIGSYRLWFFHKDGDSTNPAAIGCRVFYNQFNDSSISYSGNTYPYTDLTQTFTGTIPPYAEATYHWGEISGTWDDANPCSFKAGNVVVVGITPFGDPYWLGDNIAGVLTSPPPPVLYESTTTEPGNVYQHTISPHFPRSSTVQQYPYGTNGEFFFYNTLGTTTLTSVSEFLFWTGSRYFSPAPTEITPRLTEYVHGTPGAPLCVGTPIDVLNPSSVFSYHTRASDAFTGYGLTFDHPEDGFYYGTVPIHFTNCTIPPISGDSFYSIDLRSSAGGGGGQLGTLRDPSIIPPEGTQTDYRWNVEASVDGVLATSTATTGAPSVLFIPGTEASRLYRNLLGTEYKLWDPSVIAGQADVKALYLNPDGTSINAIYTKNGGTLAEVNYAPVFYLDIYKTFLNKLDQLKTAGTISDWSAFPYDWRMSPNDIVNNGTMYDSGVRTLTNEIERLSTNGSPVIIVAHSNGGLVAKALMEKLAQEGKANLVSKIIFVATPQLGTPQTIVSMLHGDGESLPNWGGFIVSAANARGLGENMPDAYALLPSAAYFAKVAQPVVTVATTSLFFSQSGIATTSISSSGVLTRFLTELSGRAKPAFADTTKPDVLSSSLLAHATALHNDLDTWTPPPGVQVVQIAGWGLDTIATLNYFDQSKFSCSLLGCSNAATTVHDVKWTEDGDDTVVTASAAAINAWPTYYINLPKYNDANGTQLKHLNLTETQSFQDLFAALVASSSPTTLPSYVSTSLPIPTSTDKRLRLAVHSPVSIDAYDSHGRHTGLAPNPIPGSDLTYKEEQIPNSYYEEFGDDKYIGVPNDTTNTVVLHGLGTGTFTFEITPVSGGTSGVAVSYKDIPVTASTTATAVINPNAVASTPLTLDLNGDGKVDTTLASSTQSIDPLTYIRLTEASIQTMNINSIIKQQLLAQFSSVEHLIAGGKSLDKTRILQGLNQIETYLKALMALLAHLPIPTKTSFVIITPAQITAILNMVEHLKTLIK